MMLCFAAAGPPLIASTQIAQVHLKDETVRAEYNWVTGCISNRLEIKASLTKTKEDGLTPAGSAIAAITYSTTDFCNLPVLQQTFWYGESAAVSLQVGSSLTEARLVAFAFPLTQKLSNGAGGVQDGVTTSLNVDMRWTSEDPVERIVGTFVTNDVGYHSVSQLTGRYRIALASGSMSGGFGNLIPATPDSALAQIMKLSSARLTVIKD